MNAKEARRISRPLTQAEQDRLVQARAQIAEELPDLVARDQLRREALDEPTLSAEIRRAIHSSTLSLSSIASSAGVAPLHLDEFLTGERTLRSDVLDRLSTTLGFEIKLTASR